MKVNTAVKRVCIAINQNDFNLAKTLLDMYRRKFGNRHFTYWIRLSIKNGLYFG